MEELAFVVSEGKRTVRELQQEAKRKLQLMKGLCDKLETEVI